MSFAIQEKVNGTEEKFFLRATNDGVYRVVDPSKATHFPTKGSVEHWLDNNICSTSRYKFKVIGQEELDIAISDFQKRLDEGLPYGKVVTLDQELNILFDPEKHDPVDVMDWWWKLRVKDITSQELESEALQAWTDAIDYYFDRGESIFRFLSTRYPDGYNPEYSLDVGYNEKMNPKFFRDELLFILDRYNITYRKSVMPGVRLRCISVKLPGLMSFDLFEVDMEKDLWILKKSYLTLVKLAKSLNKDSESPPIRKQSLDECAQELDLSLKELKTRESLTTRSPKK